jgi:acylphosphatase
VDARARVVFRGLVQGVNFRAHCRERAAELGLRGWVRNLGDGTVEAVFEGPRELVEACIEWNSAAQPNARVTATNVSWESATGEFSRFDIRR